MFEFVDSALQYGYYRQASLYDKAIHSDESPVKQLIDEGYTVLDFIFIVVETKLNSINPAIIYRTTPKSRLGGILGGWVGDKYYKGVNKLLEDYLWHQKTNQWDYPRDVYDNKGVITFDIF